MSKTVEGDSVTVRMPDDTSPITDDDGEPPAVTGDVMQSSGVIHEINMVPMP